MASDPLPQTILEWQTFLRSDRAMAVIGSVEFARRRSAVRAALRRWAGADSSGGLCCSSTWVDDLCKQKNPHYDPKTPCEGKSCAERGTLYPAQYVKARTWRKGYGLRPVEVGNLCDDCWAAWMEENVQRDVLRSCGINRRDRMIVEFARRTDLTQRQIAERFNLSQQRVGKILKNAGERIMRSDR